MALCRGLKTFRREHRVVSLLALPEKHSLLLFNMSTLLLSEWLYQILTTRWRCWQAPQPQLVAAKSHHGIHPKAYLSSCFACSSILSKWKWQRAGSWWKESADRQTGRDDGQSVTEREKERKKTPIRIISPFPGVTHLFLTAHALESIIWLLQWHLVLTTPVKGFMKYEFLTQWTAPLRLILYEEQVSGKTVRLMTAQGFLGPLHLAATRCTSL